jgi:hypothetical protein
MKAVKKVGFTPHKTKKVILAISIPLGLLVLFYTIAVIIDKNYWDKPFEIKSSGWFWLAYAISVVLTQLKLFKQKKNLVRIVRKITNVGLVQLKLFKHKHKSIKDTVLKSYMRPEHGKVGLIEMCQDIKEHIKNEEITIVEIGSYMGESAEIFAQQFPKAKIYCVDPFVNGYDNLDIASRANFVDVEHQFDLRAKIYPNIIKIKDFSKNVFIKTDVVYIDGCHKYECILEDIQHWLPQTSSIVSGHDYYENGAWIGVKTAVDEAIKFPDKLYSDGSWLKKINKKIGICLIIKDENDYLEEWLDHHRAIGIDHFFIYDNKSIVPINNTIINHKDVTIKIWTDDNLNTQSRAYEDCCKNNSDFDYIAFIDTDEFIILNGFNNNIKDYLKSFDVAFDALAMSWRNYGQPKPYFVEKKSMVDYVYYQENKHVKCLLNPKKVLYFPTPHFPKLNGVGINELGDTVDDYLSPHTSKHIWIKHIWSRSQPEFLEKLERGSGDKVVRNRTIKDFTTYNDHCLLKDSAIE